jgi:L-iditol 2-dehydrogenase
MLFSSTVCVERSSGRYHRPVRIASPAALDRPAVNRAAVLHGPLDLRIEERPVPAPADHEVLVEVLSVGICGSDVHYYEHGRIGSRVVRDPLVLGHEACGRVIALGASVSRHRIGDRICLEPGVPCGRCRECRSGRYNVCASVRFHGAPPVDGALANHVAVHEDFAHPLPASVSDDAGALIEPLAVALWACGKAQIAAGKRVLVTGAGPVGLLVAQTSRALGSVGVVITDVSPARLEAAAGLGFEDALDVSRTSLPETGLEVDALIECSGAAAALAAALPALRPAGIAVLVGMGEEHITLPLDLLQRRELWVTGTFRYANAFPAAIALAAQRRVELDALITHTFSLDQAIAALRSSRSDPRTLKAIVKP